MTVSSDSMWVSARSRFPGTISYNVYDQKKLYSNTVGGTVAVWDSVRLTAYADRIEWLWFDGQVVIDNLRITRAKTDTTFHLTSLNCSPSAVVRADSTACTAVWKPTTVPASEIVFTWRFVPDIVRVFPDSMNAPPYGAPDTVEVTASDMPRWSGKIVIGGRVSVIATWQGDADSAQVNLPVTRRLTSVFGNLPVTFDPDTVEHATDTTKTLAAQPPPIPGAKPGTIAFNYDAVTGNPNWTQMINGESILRSVPAGPNQGYWYVADPGMHSNRGVRMLTWLWGREEPKFSYGPGLLTNRGLLEARRKSAKSKQAQHSDSLKFLTGVWAHETYGQGGARGHQGQIELAATSLLTCGKIPVLLERVIAADSVFAFIISQQVKLEGIKSLNAAADHNYVHSNINNVTYYEIVSGTTPVDSSYLKYPAKLWVDGDLMQPADSTYYPHPDYKCTRTY